MYDTDSTDHSATASKSPLYKAVKDWRRKAYSIEAMRRLARRVLPKPVFDFSDGAAGDELTLRSNQASLDQWALVPRPLNGAAVRDTSINLFGHRLTLPVIVGPTGLAGLFAADGEQQAARAAQAAGTGYCLSHGSVCTLEQLAQTGAAPRWMQIFVYQDRSFTHEHIARAAAAGYDGIVLTIDNQLVGSRERDLRNGFTIPPQFSLTDMIAMAPKLPWLLRMRKQLANIKFGNYERYEQAGGLASMAALLPSLLDPGLNWDDVKDIRRQWPGTLLIKGILHPDDALAAIDHGVDGIIVSNHGGRQLDAAVASISALPQIARVVDNRIPVLLDGGVRRGRHVLTAIALGASACLIARPQLWGLAVAGQQGVEHVLDIYQRELDLAMGLCGIENIAGITDEVLFNEHRALYPDA